VPTTAVGVSIRMCMLLLRYNIIALICKETRGVILAVHVTVVNETGADIAMATAAVAMTTMTTEVTKTAIAKYIVVVTGVEFAVNAAHFGVGVVRR